MARTAQEGAASLKIMKIPLQPGAAQHGGAALRRHSGDLWRLCIQPDRSGY